MSTECFYAALHNTDVEPEKVIYYYYWYFYGLLFFVK